MQLFAIGINYRTAPVALRERVVFPLEQIKSALQALNATWGSNGLSNPHAGLPAETAILSTCHRTEIYGVALTGNASSMQASMDAGYAQCAARWLSACRQIPFSELTPHLYTLPHSSAVRHVFRVASGLDSMVLGETQILGQLKAAARAALDAGALGAYLNRLFQHSFSAAKAVRGQTQIGAHSVSIASAAVRLAQRIFERLSSQRVLLVGAGSMIGVCAAHFAAQRPHALVIANRTIERSLKLAERTNGRAIALASLPARLHEFDIVVSCTASVLPIIGLGVVERALRARKRRPVLMVDLAMPRDIEAEVAQLQDVFLYTLDDLGAVVQKAHTQRQTAAIQAEAIIETRVERFMRWLDARRGAPAICKLHEEAHRLRSAALARAQQRLACGEDPKAVLEAFSYRLTHTLLHAPTRALMREHAELAPLVEHYAQWQQAHADEQTARGMLDDPALRDFAADEARKARDRMAQLEAQLQTLLLPKDPDDARNIFLEIRAGTGGEESALFAGVLLRMYLRYAERQRWQVEILSESLSETGGYKEVIARIAGHGAYSRLKFESGGHRVQRVPETEAQGRIHTSACTVPVLSEADQIGEVDMNPADLRVDTFRASGAGGQHVNKTDSAVRITHLPTGLVVECQDDRSQHRNRERALQVLAARLKDRRIQEQNAEISATRKRLIGSGDRSERIRTYNFPQGRMTDHRIHLTLYKLDAILDGALDELIDALVSEHQAELLAANEDE